jgi:hypothetical protein
MLLRLMLALGGVTFLAAGIGISFTDSCNSVTWGSRGPERVGSFTATCNDVFVADGMSRAPRASWQWQLGCCWCSRFRHRCCTVVFLGCSPLVRELETVHQALARGNRQSADQVLADICECAFRKWSVEQQWDA